MGTYDPATTMEAFKLTLGHLSFISLEIIYPQIYRQMSAQMEKKKSCFAAISFF